ncbi:MAG: CHASE domain-containing protein, partial [Bacteriovorax sp.]|nr:CHASE domain-containing protein [Bacteriovorax sp.]
MQFKIPNRTFLPNLIFFSFVYFLTARLGLMLATINHSVSPVWPATGLAFGILFIFGFRFWPAIAIGAFSANILNTGTFTSAFLITVGNTSQALVGTFILHYFIYRTDKFGSHNRTLGIVLASLVGSCLSATVGTTALAITGVTTWRLYRAIWFTWSAGDFLGGITILPLMLAFFSNEYSKQFDEFRKSRIKLTSIAALIVSGIFLCWIVFFRPDGTPYLFLLFPLLLCCVGMAGERGVTIATILISIVGIVSVQLGFGVFIHGSTNVNLINLQLFLGSVGISSLIMSDLKRVSSLRQPAIILLFSWLIAGIFFFTLYNRSIEETNKHFQVVVDSVGPMLEARMKFYFSPLQSETALFAASQKVTHLEWKQYLNYSDYFNQLPGVEGFGVVFRVYKKDLQHFIKARKVEGLNKFKYHLLPNISKKDLQKTNDSLESFVVTYIEPYEKNILKAGLDMYSESNRRIAAEIARDTGLPTITSKIFLLDDPKKRPAFLAYSPLYTKGPVPKTINERRARILGWVYATVIYRDFFDSIFLHKNYKELSYSVTEANNESSTPLVASSTDYDKLPKSDIESRSINVGNHNFILNFKRSAAFISKQDNFSSWTGVTASILSLLIGTFIVSLQSVKKSAIDLANRKTMDLKASEEL